MEKVDYDKLKEKEIWREIPGFDGRYIMSTWDRIIDTQPVNLWGSGFGTWTEERQRDLVISSSVRLYKNDKKRAIYRYTAIKKMTFPDLYDIGDEEINQIKERIANNQHSITFDLDTFNRLIYPNKLYYLLDVTQYKGKKWRKPTKVEIDGKNHTFTLFKKRKYIGVGVYNLIHFKDLMPFNGKPFADGEAKERRRLYMKKKRGSEKEYITGIFD